MVIGIRTEEKFVFEFTMIALCWVLGFCVMSSAWGLSNPIFLNHEHFLFFFGPMSVLAAIGANEWRNKPNCKSRFAVLVALGIFVAFFLEDPKMGGYLTGMGLLYVFVSDHKLFKPVFVLLLILPVAASFYFQIQTKNYPHFKKHLNEYVLSTENHVPILTNNFVFLSSEELLSELPSAPENLFRVADWNKTMDQNPDMFKIFIYKYYRHAYPDEQEFISSFDLWLSTSPYKTVEVFEDDWIHTKTFRKFPKEELFQSLLSPCGEDPVDIETYPEFISGSSVTACQ